MALYLYPLTLAADGCFCGRHWGAPPDFTLTIANVHQARWQDMICLRETTAVVPFRASPRSSAINWPMAILHVLASVGRKPQASLPGHEDECKCVGTLMWRRSLCL